MIENKQFPSPQYIPEIDGLRAIAILSVLLFHANLGISSGFIGVDVFFVISGYLITKILAEEWEKHQRIELFRFYAKRFRRLFPALLALVVIILPLSALFLSPHGEFKEAAVSAAAGITYVSNFFFQFRTTDYFGPETDHMPFLHMWSLAVEEQFYLLWPLILTLLLKRKKLAKTCFMFGLIIASLVFAEYWVHRAPQLAFFQMPSRFWELTAGSVIAVSGKIQYRHSSFLSGFGLCLILISCIWEIKVFPGLSAIPAVLGATMVLHCVHNKCELGIVGRILSMRPLVYIGLISYSLYLWHWPLLALLRVSTADEPSINSRILICFAAVGIAGLSYRYIERPIRSLPLTGSPKALVASGLVASLSVAAVSVSIGQLNDYPAPPTDFASITSRDQPNNRFTCHLRADQVTPIAPNDACMREDNRPRSLAIWGDSMAFAWQPFAWLLADSINATTISYSRDACAPVLGHQNGLNRNLKKLCEDFNTTTISKMPRMDILILAARWQSVFKNKNSDPAQEKLEAMLVNTISAALQISEHIYIIGPTPRLTDTAPRCIRLNALQKCEVPRIEFESKTDYTRTLLKEIADGNQRIRYIEPTGFFCESQSCPPVKNGIGLYWDSYHVTRTAARAFYEFYTNQASRHFMQTARAHRR